MRFEILSALDIWDLWVLRRVSKMWYSNPVGMEPTDSIPIIAQGWSFKGLKQQFQKDALM
jgi:hypothetical protein